MAKDDINEMKLDITTLKIDVTYIKDKLDDILDKLDNKYVTKEELGPVKAIVYGFSGIVLTSVIGSLVYLVIK